MPEEAELLGLFLFFPPEKRDLFFWERKLFGVFDAGCFFFLNRSSFWHFFCSWFCLQSRSVFFFKWHPRNEAEKKISMWTSNQKMKLIGKALIEKHLPTGRPSNLEYPQWKLTNIPWKLMLGRWNVLLKWPLFRGTCYFFFFGGVCFFFRWFFVREKWIQSVQGGVCNVFVGKS